MTRKFTVSRPAQHEYRVLGGGKPSGADAIARTALDKARASRKPEAVHVTKRSDGWAVKTAGRERAATVKPTKRQAIDSARAVAVKRGARVVEHAKDGKILHNTKPKTT